MRLLGVMSLIFLIGCAHETVRNQASNGALTEVSKTSFLNRSTMKVQSQTGTTNPVPPLETAQLPDTHSNLTGFENGIPTLGVARSQMPYSTREVGINDPNANFFYYDSQSDPEPAVRAIRIGTVGAVAAYGIGAVN